MAKMKFFEIDPDISTASTLPSGFYTDQDYFEESKEKIFSKTWQLVDFKPSGASLFPHLLLQGFLNEPVLITRDNQDSLRCVSNVCTHRGKILVEKKGNAAVIKCGYHGRAFDLEGKISNMPEFELTVGFPSREDDLAQIPLENWNDFIFVALDSAAPLADFISPLEEALPDFDYENLQFSGRKDYFVKSHWALYCENYVEGFHIPFVHRALNREIDYGNYTTELFRYSSIQTARDNHAKIAARYVFVFPNLMLNFYDWGISVNIVKPQKKDLTKITYLTLVNNDSALHSGPGADLDTVEIEDQAVVESVQSGIDSRFYDRGRYSPTREQGTHHFHRLISEFMRR